jgi:hypothetical protein
MSISTYLRYEKIELKRGSFWHSAKQEVRTFAEFIGLRGFIMKSVFNSVYPDQNKGKDVYLQGSRQMDSLSRQYYERNLGAGMRDPGLRPPLPEFRSPDRSPQLVQACCVRSASCLTSGRLSESRFGIGLNPVEITVCTYTEFVCENGTIRTENSCFRCTSSCR